MIFKEIVFWKNLSDLVLDEGLIFSLLSLIIVSQKQLSNIFYKLFMNNVIKQEVTINMLELSLSEVELSLL